jgi:two-component system, NarL family, invasion response regulator UvrY
MDQPILAGGNHPGVNKSLREWSELSLPSYQLWEAATGEAAMTTAQDASPCLVIMDIGLPGMSGIEATLTIKELVGSAQMVKLAIYEDDDYRNHAGAAAAGGSVAEGKVKTELLPAMRRVPGKQNGVVAHD